MTFKITAREKALILKRRKVQALKFETLLDPITVDDLLMTVAHNEPDRSRSTIKRVFDEMVRENVVNARDVFKSQLSQMEKELSLKYSTD